MTASEFHVSSVVVRAAPAHLGRLSGMIAGLEGAEVHATDPRGKMIVTLEAASEAEALGMVERIRGMSGAVDVSLVYHQCEREDPGECAARAGRTPS